MKREMLGVVLCGGRSERMGADKAELEVRPGIRQLDYLLDLLAMVCDERAACVGPQSVAKRALPPRVSELFDEEGLGGPMAGIVAALRFAAGKPVLAVACDMPYLEVRHLVQLVNRRDPDSLATAFRSEDCLPEPMCAIYEAAALPVMENRIREDRLSLRGLLQEGPAELIDCDEPEFLASLNDAEALQKARFFFAQS